MASTGSPTKQSGPQPGQLFGYPGITRWTEQRDLNSNNVTTLQQATSAPMIQQVPFKQTDIVFGWRWGGTWAGTWAAGGQVLNLSQYAPYNIPGQIKLSVTNLYDLIDVQSGIDLAFFNAHRPFRQGRNFAQNVETAPGAWPFSPETNNDTSGTFTTGTTTYPFSFWLPACAWFDEYMELDKNGRTVGLFSRVPVSPLYMSGTARDILPNITFNPGLAANTDQGPVVATGAGAATFTGGSYTHDFRRIGIYGTTNPPEMPTVYNWRYALTSKRVSLGAVSQVDVPLKTVINNGGGGQVLSLFVRFYNPAGGAASQGASIPISSLSLGRLNYGSALIRYEDTPATMQARYFQQHNLNPPIGFWVWDMGLDFSGRFTNALALNAYTTDLTLHFEFTGTQSASSYMVIGTEYLTYVEDQPTAA